MARRTAGKSDEPTTLNRKARHEYTIDQTLEVGIALQGSEVKSVRAGGVSLQEGYVRVTESPPTLELHSVHIQEYPPAAGRQHAPTRVRRLLAHRREIESLAGAVKEKGVTIIPLRMYFSKGRVKLEIGVARGKRKGDKRQDLRKREAERDIERAMSKRL